MRKIIGVSCAIAVLVVSTTFVLAQGKSWEDYGLTEEAVRYLSEAEKQEILNSLTPEQTIAKRLAEQQARDALQVIPLEQRTLEQIAELQKYTLPDPLTPEEMQAQRKAAREKQAMLQKLTPEQRLKQQEIDKQAALDALTPEEKLQLQQNGTTGVNPLFLSFSGPSQGTLEDTQAIKDNKEIINCFDYYVFGSVTADMTSQSTRAIAGMEMDFSGTIKNNNPYPIVAGTLYVKIFKNTGGEKNPNGPDVVDQFIAVDDITLPANGSVPAAFKWNIPAYAQKGDYRLVTYFTSDKKFNLLGLSFTDDIVGNSFDFTVDGEAQGVAFDKSSVVINENPYFFAAYPPRITGEDAANISLALKNTTDTPQSILVQWKLYKWDSMRPENLVREFTTSTELSAKSSNTLELSISEKEEPVYYLVGELIYKDTKSLVNIRYVRDGVDKARLNFPSITSYPIKAGESTTLFTCLHNSGQSAQIGDNKVILQLKNEAGKVVKSYTYKGIITGDMMAIKTDFTSKVDLNTFSVQASLYTNNTLVDQSIMKYDCALIDSTKCTQDTGGSIVKGINKGTTNILIGILALFVLVILIMILKRKKNIVVSLIVMALLPCVFQPVVTEAKSNTWNTQIWGTLSYFWNRWQGTGWEPALINPNISVQYHVEIIDVVTETVISDEDEVPVGTKLLLKFVPHQYTDISWFGTGRSGDSPYGEWITNAAAPPFWCNPKDYIGEAYQYGYHWTVYIPLVVNPPAGKSITGFDNLDCGPLSGDETNGYTMNCEVIAAGDIRPQFNFTQTYGRFFYRYWDYRSGRMVGGQGPGCYGNQIPLNYVLQVPAQTISYDFTAFQPPPLNNPPNPPDITGPITGSILTPYTFGIRSTDPNEDTIKYLIDWNNDGFTDQLLPSSGLIASGAIVNANKSWATAGVPLTFKARAEDQHGLQSGWTTHTITLSNLYILTIAKTGTGSGTVTGAGSYSVGTPVTLTADPAEGSAFTGWSGDPDCTDGSVTMTADKNCIATFTALTVSVTATTPYTVNPSAPLAFAHVPTTTTGSTECRLLDHTALLDEELRHVELTSYATTNPITSISAPTIAGQYLYYIECRNKIYTTISAISNPIIVNVNAAPIVNAGGDKTIVSPANSVSITGTATDTDGTIASTLWTKISGPNSPSITTPSQLTTNLTGLIVGTYVFRLTATDNGGLTGMDEMTVVVHPAPPVVTLTADPLTGPAPLDSILRWTVIGTATSCTAGDGWTGPKTVTNDSQPINDIMTGTTYTLFCTNAGGNSNIASATVTPTGAISVSLTATPPGPLFAPGAIHLSWTTVGNPESCDASGDWTGTNVINDSPITQQNVATAKTYTFTITCHKTGSPDATSTVNVVVNSGPTGTLAATNCTIPAGQGNCNTTLTWTTTNPITTSEVTTPTNIPVANANDGTTTYPVARGSRDFSLRNNSLQLATATATASCTPGTTWNTATSKCISPITATCTSSSPVVTAAGQSVTWTATVTGGSTPYTYSWSGDDSLSGTTVTITKNYTTGGIKKAFVAVTSGAYTGTVPCTDATVDLCLNISGPQTTIPNNTNRDASGNCLNIQACQEALVYNGGVNMGAEPISSAPFTGKIVCLSDKPYALGTPFSVKVGSNDWINGIGLAPFDIFTALGFGGGFISIPQENHFTYGRTNVICRVDPGDGNYVTSTACQKSICVGDPEQCKKPVKFEMVSTNNPSCTNSEYNTYKIGCSEYGYTPETCKTEFENLQYVGGIAVTEIVGQVAGIPRTFQVVCTLGPLPDAKYDNITCTVTLPSGQGVVEIYNGDYGNGGRNYQTINSIRSRDNDDPEGTIVDTPTGGPYNSKVFLQPRWSNVPVPVRLECKNGTEGGDTCNCDGVKDEIVGPDSFWRFDSLSDTTIFTRTFTEGLYRNKSFYVTDNAGNPRLAGTKSKVRVSVGVDTTPPTILDVQQTSAGGSTSLMVKAKDTLSGIMDIQINYMPDTTDLETFGGCTPITAGLINTTYDQEYTKNSVSYAARAGYKFIYCIWDAAGNLTKGDYPPSIISYYSCFADGSMMNPVPTLWSYENNLTGTDLYKRLTSATPQFGHSLSDSARATQNSTFLTQLSQNINTFIKNKYTPDSITSIADGNDYRSFSLDDDGLPNADKSTARLKEQSITRNTNGYYWYADSSNSRKYVTLTEVIIRSPKVLLVEGADVQINGNITYNGANASLVIIVRKDNNGKGGNIYIDPRVGNISATLIADGALMNRDGSGSTMDGWTRPAELKQKLTINGRLVTYNTRGGSYKVTTAPPKLEGIGVDNGKCFTGSTLINNCGSAQAASQDLERFRVTDTSPRSNNDKCTLYVVGTTPTVIDILSNLVF